MNERKTCTPVTPLGECPSIEVDKVFLQGSCDAMLMAWNLVDAINKEETDVFDPVVVIDGVIIPRLLFVDDILEIIKSVEDLGITVVGNETFEKANRLCFKQSKCKIICSNCEVNLDITMNGVKLEIVDEHEYLGTIIASEGRESDMKKRIGDCKGVLNEIVEICKMSGIGEIRMIFVTMLIAICFKSKFKYGCEVWDRFTKAELSLVNKLIPDMLKRVLELPRSTPTTAIIHDLGVVDLDLEVAMERILLASKISKLDENRVSKLLFKSLFEKGVPGFCTNMAQDMKMVGIGSLEALQTESNERKAMKDRLVGVQKDRLTAAMMCGSKTDAMLLNFSYDGHMKKYFTQLSFRESRIVFMLRARMFPTKSNFPNRWSQSKLCVFCCCLDTDEHLFHCCGYMDLHNYELSHEMFLRLDGEPEVLSYGAKILIQIHDRLVQINEDEEINKCAD